MTDDLVKRDEEMRLARRLASMPMGSSPIPAYGWQKPIARAPAPCFYDSDAWIEMRYRALQLHGGHCQCCGNAPVPGNPLHVDHIKPRSKFPELELDLHNLQVLCRSCNIGKGAWDQTDWRRR